MDNRVRAEMILTDKKKKKEKNPCQITEAQTKKGKIDI